MGERRWYRICWYLVLFFTGEAWIAKLTRFRNTPKSSTSLAVNDAVNFHSHTWDTPAEHNQQMWRKVSSSTTMQEEASLLEPMVFNISDLGISLANASIDSMGSGVDPHRWLHELLSLQQNNPEAVDSGTVDKLITSFGFTILSSPSTETIGHEVASFLSGLARLGVPWSALATRRLLCILIDQAIASAFPNELSVIVHSLGELRVNQAQDLPSTLTASLLDRLSSALTVAPPRVLSCTLWGLKECRFRWKQYVHRTFRCPRCVCGGTLTLCGAICVVGFRSRCVSSSSAPSSPSTVKSLGKRPPTVYWRLPNWAFAIPLT